jgi:hypothetical protein
VDARHQDTPRRSLAAIQRTNGHQDRAGQGPKPGGAPRTTATGCRLDHDHEPDAEEAGGSVLPITIIVVIIETYLDATNVSVMIQP